MKHFNKNSQQKKGNFLLIFLKEISINRFFKAKQPFPYWMIALLFIFSTQFVFAQSSIVWVNNTGDCTARIFCNEQNTTLLNMGTIEPGEERKITPGSSWGTIYVEHLITGYEIGSQLFGNASIDWLYVDGCRSSSIPEICGNGIDDDFDGSIDENDPTGIAFSQVVPTCSNNVGQDDGTISLTSHTNGTHYGISSAGAASYDGPTTQATATHIPGTLPVLIQSNTSNAGTTYIVRIFNYEYGCYRDETVTVNEENCSPDCSIASDGLANETCTGIDAISLDLTPTGTSTGTNYNVSASGGTATSISPTSGTYNTATTFTLNDNSAGGGDVTITITDIDDPSCTREVVVTDPGTCASTCSINYTVADVTCTGTDAINFELTSTGTDVGATYNVSVSGGAATSISPTSGTYDAATIFTLNDNSAGGGDVTITLTDVDDPTCTVDVVVTDPGTCPPVSSYDVSLTKTVDLPATTLGSSVIFTIVVENLEDAVTGTTINDVLPAGLTYNGVYTASTGTYDGANWVIGDMAVGQVDSIQITATADAEGVVTNIANVNINETETDLTNNEDNACVSVPVQICDNEAINVELTAQIGLNSYQWYQDGVAIDGATSNIYIATEIGIYTYTSDGAGPTGDCEGELCCPVIIEQVSCCAPVRCIPITITKAN